MSRRKAKPPSSVVAAVESELAQLGKRDPDLAGSALAATALALARELDGKNSATSKSMCAKALNETMGQLRELAPESEEADKVDDLAARRKKRRERKSAAAG